MVHSPIFQEKKKTAATSEQRSGFGGQLRKAATQWPAISAPLDFLSPRLTSLQNAFLLFPLFGSDSEGLLQTLLSVTPHRLQNASLADLLKWSLTAAKIRISRMTTLLAATQRVS